MSTATSVRRFIPVAMHSLAGALCLFASILGAISLISAGRAAGKGLVLMYGVPLLLLLPVYCASFFWPRVSAALQLLAAIFFAVANSMVDAQACGGSHVCSGFASTFFKSFFDPLTLTPFVIAALQIVAIYMRQAESAPIRVRHSI
jgi:hypothetical protein